MPWLSDEPQAVRDAATNLLRRRQPTCEIERCPVCAFDKELIQKLIDAVRLDVLGRSEMAA